jgi:ABC-type multidrug transport system fused ATPase/permease subunit
MKIITTKHTSDIRITFPRKKLIRQFRVHNKLNYVLTLLLSIVICCLNLFTAYLFKEVADIAAGGTMHDVTRLLAISGVFILAYVIASLIKRHFLNEYVRKAIFQFKNYFMGTVLYKNMNAFNEGISNTYISALTNDLASIETNYVLGGVLIFINIFTFVLGLGVMFALSWIMTLTILVACLMPIGLTSLYGKNIVNAEKNLSKENSSFLSGISSIFSGFAVIKSFQSEREILTSFITSNGRLESVKRLKRNAVAASNLISFASSFLVTAAVCCLGAVLAINGQMSIGMIIAFIQLLDSALNPLQALGPLFSSRRGARELINNMACAMDTNDDEEVNRIACVFKEQLKFENICYEIDGKVVLRDINLLFEAGKCYAVVGASGSGKSTLLHLMLGYADDYAGTIKIDDIEISNVRYDSLYKTFSVILQDVFIFDDTIINNITMLKEFGQEDVEMAILRSGLTKLIEEKGLEYRCGENGCWLSGGEKQRIAIARCLIRKAPVLLMDEATAALDNDLDYFVQSEIVKLSGLARILVTHRYNAEILQKFDEIIVLKNGTVAEKGTFDQLISNKGYFYSLFTVNNL